MNDIFENWAEYKAALLEGLTPAKQAVVAPLLENQKNQLFPMIQGVEEATMYLSSSYMSKVYDTKKFAALAKRVAKRMVRLKSTLKFDAIAFTGSSGAALAYPVSVITGIPLVHVRKTENSHGQSIEGSGKITSYIILDDFIDSGATIKRIHAKISSARCVGIALYNHAGSLGKFRKRTNVFWIGIDGIPMWTV